MALHQQPQHAAELPGPPLHDDQQHRQDLGREQDHRRGHDQQQRPLRLPHRPLREQCRAGREVIRGLERLPHRLAAGQQQEHQPQQRRHVGHDAVDEQRPMGREQALGEQQAQVLQVALAPAAVALHGVQQGRRQLLVAARQVVRQPDGPAAAAQQGRFDEVVTEDVATERRAARQARQAAVLAEGLDADDGVVAPERPVAQLPEMQAGGEDRPVGVAGELQHAREQRVLAHRLWQGLDQAHARAGFHHVDQLHQRLAAHHAVGVEHHHVAVVRAPAAHEIGHVAALALQIHVPVPVKKPPAGAHLPAQRGPGDLLVHPAAGILRVTEDEKVEAVDLTGGGQGLVGRAQAGPDPPHVLGEHRQQHRRASGRIDRPHGTCCAHQVVAVAAQQQADETDRGGPQADRNPAKQHAEHDDDGQLQPGAPAVGQHLAHELAGDGGRDQHQAQQQHPSPGGGEGVRPVEIGVAHGRSWRPLSSCRRRSTRAAGRYRNIPSSCRTKPRCRACAVMCWRRSGSRAGISARCGAGTGRP